MGLECNAQYTYYLLPNSLVIVIQYGSIKYRVANVVL